MHPLTLDDILSLEEYAIRRHELRASLSRYVDQYRRIRVGPSVTFLFENRQTLWFRLQEILHVARLADPGRIQAQLDLFNRLLPGRNQLQSALMIDILDVTKFSDELAFWRVLRDDDIQFQIGDKRFPARLLTCRPEDRAIATAHWVQFDVDKAGVLALSQSRASAFISINHDSYRHQSPPLSDEVRQSLAEDLTMFQRDAA